MRFVAALAGLILLLANPAAAQDRPPPLTRVAFGSCADQKLPQPIWGAVLGYRPELFLFVGDNVYGDVTSPEMQELKAAYAQTAAVDGYARLLREVPFLATWDDHDFGKNDAGGDFELKDTAKQLYLDFWQVPEGDPRRTRGGVHHARTFGPEGQRVQVIMLDTRYFRSALRPTDQRGAPGKERYLPDEDPTKTMLGAEQWAWLEEQLREPAELRLVVSSVQVLADGHGWERWGNFPRERAKLVELIARTGANGVLFLSGDRHIAGVYEGAAGAPYRMVELTSSGLNKTYATPGDLLGNRVGAPYGAENFGTIDIDWWQGEARLAVRNMGGEPVRETRVRLEELKAGG